MSIVSPSSLIGVASLLSITFALQPGDVFVVDAGEALREQHVDLLDVGAFLLAGDAHVERRERARRDRVGMQADVRLRARRERAALPRRRAATIFLDFIFDVPPESVDRPPAGRSSPVARRACAKRPRTWCRNRAQGRRAAGERRAEQSAAARHLRARLGGASPAAVATLASGRSARARADASDAALPGSGPSPSSRKHEHRRAEVGQPERHVGNVRSAARAAKTTAPPASATFKTRSPARRAHRIGTFTVRLYCSNSETRSITSMFHVPPGLSTAEFRT